MRLVDMHCHVDEYDSPASVVTVAEENRVYTIAVTNLPSAFEQIEILLQGRRYLRPALGLHPQNAYRHHSEMARMWSLLHRTRYVGEIGLDYSTPHSEDRQVQRYVFSKILERCSSAGDKVLSIHSRRAAADVISAIGPEFPGKVILHWFAGSRQQLEQAISYGCYFSVNPAMVRSKRGASLIPAIPQDRLLTESDGPYVKVNRKQAQPPDVSSALRSLAVLLGLGIEEMTRVVFESFRELLGDVNDKEREGTELLAKNSDERGKDGKGTR